VNPNNGVSDAETTRVSQLGILQLTPTEWLVRDARRPEGDPAALMGIIKQSHDAYEVTKLGVLTTRWFYSSFEHARASFLDQPAPSYYPAPLNQPAPVGARIASSAVSD
jgi:hypothetical protein